MESSFVGWFKRKHPKEYKRYTDEYARDFMDEC